MKQLVLATLAAAFAAAPAWADPALAQKKNCMGCHAIDRKIVGPAYKDVAKKYAGQNVSAKLSAKIIQGGAGTWGVVPMPANPKISPSEAETLVNWILALK